MLNQDKGKDIKLQNNFQPNDLIRLIDKYDANMLIYLARIYEALHGEKMDLTKIESAVDALAAFKNKQEYCYLDNLLYPERCKGVKIPTPIPVPSCAFQLHNTVTLSTNNIGCLGFMYNPFYLGNKTQLPYRIVIPGIGESSNTTMLFTSSAWLNNHNSLTGSNSNHHWLPINLGQDIPNVYDQYRLVSASIVVKYIGRLDNVSGVIGGGIIFDESQLIGGEVGIGSASMGRLLNPEMMKYGNFDLIMDSFYHQENMIIEGMRELYFPIDNSFEEYVKLNDVGNWTFGRVGNEQIWDGTSRTYARVSQDYYKAGFNFFVYTLNAPPSSACLKLDIYCNYECLPNAQFLNYLPLSMNAMGVSAQEKKDACMIVQQKPIMSLKNGQTQQQTTSRMPNIWEKMKKKFSNSLPGIDKLISLGILRMLPGYKSSTALASAFINTQANVSQPPSKNSVNNGNIRPMEDVE